MVGALAGAFSAAMGVAISLFISTIVLQLVVNPGETWNDPLTSVKFSMFTCGFGSWFAGVIGLPTGMLVALVDILAHGRLRASGFPFWLWLPIGFVLSATGYIVTFGIMFGTDFPMAVLAGFCGLIAGPLFGWLYRERTRPINVVW
jgi:hypothetical protein